MKPAIKLLTGLTAALFTTISGLAQSTWDGDTNGNWSTATNWDVAPVSGNTLDIIYHAPGAGNVSVSRLGGANYTVRSLTFNSNATGNATGVIGISFNNGGATIRELTMEADIGPAQINIGSDVPASTITMGNGGSGSVYGNMTLASNLLVNHNGNGSFTINRPILETGGSRSLTKTGTGVLSVGGANNFSGVLTVAEGMYSGGGPNNDNTTGVLGNSTNSVVLGGIGTTGILRFAGGTGNTSNKTFTLAAGGSGGFNVSVSTGIYTLDGTISGDGNLIKEGPGTIILNTANSYAGNTTVTNGALLATTPASLPGYDGLNKVAINGGRLSVRTGNGTNGWSWTQIDTLLGNATKTSGTLGIDTTNQDTTQSTAINMGPLGLAKLGSGNLTLNQANNYTGATTISIDGTLRITHANALGSTDGDTNIGGGGNSVALLEIEGGLLSVAENIVFGGKNNDSITLRNVSGSNTLTGNVSLGSGGTQYNVESVAGLLTINSNLTTQNSNTRFLNISGAGDVTLGGAISNNGAGTIGVTKSGAGTLRLTNNGSIYSRPTTISEGVLEVTTLANGGSPSSIGNSTNAAANLNLAGGTLRYSGTTVGTASTDRLFTVSASSIIDASGTGNSGALVRFTNTGNILWGTANETRTLTLNAGTVGNNIIDSLITDNGEGTVSIVKNGSGNWQFTANNTYSGGTTINGGFLRIGAGTASGSVGSGDVTLNGGTFSSGRIDTFEINNLITGSGTVHMNNTGVMVLTNNNTYSGLTNVNANGGTIQMGNGGTTGSIGTSNISINTGGIFRFNRADDLTIDSTITGSGILAKTANNTLTLTNSFANELNIEQGAVSVGSFAGSSNITIGSIGNDGRLIYTGATSTTVRRMHFADSTNATIEVTNPNTTLSLGLGSIGGSATLVKEGPGTLNLSSNETFHGSTDIIEGTLLLNSTKTQTGGVFAIQPGATLGGSGNTTNSIISYDGTIAPGASAEPGVVGTLTALQALDTTEGAEDDEGNPIPGAASTLAIDLVNNACDKLVLTGGNFTPGTFKLAINATGTQTLPAYVIVDSQAANNGGPFFEITGLPDGYGVVYNYNDGSDTFNIAIVSGVSSDPFSTYMVAMGLEGAAMTDDSDNDGYSNLEEFMFDGHANVSGKPKGAPTHVLDATYLTITYGRSQTAMTQPGISVGVEYSTSLATDSWATAQNGVNGVIITEIIEDELTEAFGAETYSGDLGVDKIIVQIPRSLAGSGGKLFGRVKVAVTAP